MSYAMTSREAIADATMSDDTLRDERKAQELVQAAITVLTAAARHTSLNSGQIWDAIGTLPNMTDWNTEINDARRYA